LFISHCGDEVKAVPLTPCITHYKHMLKEKLEKKTRNFSMDQNEQIWINGKP
jgi:hypothetical protein